MRITSVILSLMIVVSLTGTGVSSTEISPEQRFVTYAFSECNQVLITWEQVPNAESYKLFRNGIDLTELNKHQNVYLDTDLDDNTYTYSVNAISKTDNVISTSIPVTATTHCYETFECNTDMKFVLGDNYYFVNETKKGPMPIPPLISKDRTFLVIRYVTDELGAEIKWDGVQRKVSIITFRGKSIELIIGNNTAVVDGKEILIDPSDPSVVPIIESGRTLLPMRFVADQMGAEDVIWNDQEKSITLRFHNESICIPQKLLLTVNQINCQSKQQIVANDSCNNQFEITLDEDDTICDTLSINDRIIVGGHISEIRKNGESDSIQILCTNLSIIGNNQSQKGRIESIHLENNRGIITIDTCDDSQSFYFTPGLYGLELVSKDSWINFNSSDDHIITDWSYITNDTHCNLKSNEFIISEKNLNPDGFWYVESLTSEDRNILIPGADINFDDLDTGSHCYVATYSTNWLGRNICTSTKEIDCGCNIFVSPIEPSSVKMYPNSQYKFPFSIKNNGEKRKKLLLKITETDVEGTIKFLKSVIYVDPGEETTATILVFATEVSGEIKSIVYSVICDGEQFQNTLYVEVIGGTTNYSIDVVEGLVINNNTKFVHFPFSVKNDSYASICVQAVLSSSSSLTNHSVSPKVAIIQPGETIHFKATGELKYSRVIGSTINLFLSIGINGITEITSIPVEIDRSGRPVVDVDYEIDETGLATISGKIDWRTFTKDILTVTWGDGHYDEFDKFPVSHQYEKAGIYPVIVCAKTLDAELYPTALGYGYCVIEYNKKTPDIVQKITFEKIGEFGLKYKLSGILYSGHNIQRIRVDWGDGQTATIAINKDSFERTYSYQANVRRKFDMDYLVNVLFMKKNPKTSKTAISNLERFRITIPGTWSY